MPTTITGTDGVSQVQTGAVESGDLPAGSVIQVVSQEFLGTNTGEIVTTSTSFVDTGVSASITPQSANSKILVSFVLGAALKYDVDTVIVANIVRNTTQLIQTVSNYNNASQYSNDGSILLKVLDTPSTNTSVTYKAQIKSGNTGEVGINSNIFGDLGDSTITLMEIAG